MDDAVSAKLSAYFERADSSSVVVIKRLWDETGIRLQMRPAELQRLLGEKMATALTEAKERGRSGRGSFYPGYVVQCMQQMCFVRWANGPLDGCEVVLPAKLVSTNTADSIWAALRASMPALSPQQMIHLASRVRVLVIYQFPDGLPSNVVVMFHLAERIPSALVFSGHCCAHLLQLVWDTGAKKDLACPLYQCCQLISNSKTCAKVSVAMESLALETDVHVCVKPSDEHIRFNKLVLESSVRRPLIIRSFFADPGGLRGDVVADAEMVENLDRRCSAI